MEVGPIILLGNPLSDAPRRARSGVRLPAKEWERNREADFRGESALLAAGSAGRRGDKMPPLPDFFLSQVGPTSILQNSTITSGTACPLSGSFATTVHLSAIGVQKQSRRTGNGGPMEIIGGFVHIRSLFKRRKRARRKNCCGYVMASRCAARWRISGRNRV